MKEPPTASNKESNKNKKEKSFNFNNLYFDEIYQAIQSIQNKKSLIVAVLAFILIFYLAKNLYQWMHAGAKKEAAYCVQTVRVKAQNMPVVVETVGSLSARKELKLKAPTPGKVARILVNSGVFVKAGTELIKIIGGPEIRAPFDAFLDDWRVEEGDYVASGTELVDCVNTDELSISYRVPEQYAPLLDLNQTVDIKVRAFPERQFSGKVSFMAPVIDKKTATVAIRADINNTEQSLWPGMSAHVRHYLLANPSALVVPESALELTLEGYQLWVVQDNKLVVRKVELGNRMAGRVEVKKGVSLNEQILLTRNDNTEEEGKEVTIQEWEGNW